MLRTCHSFLASALLYSLALPVVCVTAWSQTPSAPTTKLALSAALVLTPEFCATKTKKGTWGINQETFPIGKAACDELEPTLKDTFLSLSHVQDASSAGGAQLVLIPKLVDAGATQTLGAFSNRELVVMVEWTVKDKGGKTVWVETVQGSAKHHMGNAFTHGKNVKLIVNDSVKDMAEQSAAKMAASPELQKLTSMSSEITCH